MIVSLPDHNKFEILFEIKTWTSNQEITNGVIFFAKKP